MQKLRAVRVGQQVIVRDEPWLVVRSEAFHETSLVTLRGVSVRNRGETLRVVTPFDTVLAQQSRIPLRLGTRRQALVAAAMAIAEAPRWNDTWTAASARIDLRPWQLEPALAVIRGASRVLLADGVGLGKTIQALLIVSELFARGLARRVLVLSPASLRDQWADEATQRFGLTATIFDHATLAASASLLPIGVNPWSTAALIVSSIDLVKRGDVRAALDAVAFDLLIVDEAHHLTPATDRAAVVSDLAARTPWLVLLSATPHTGDDAAFRFLCGLGAIAGEGEGELTTFRRHSKDVNASLSPRKQRSIAVSTTTAERALIDGTLAYADAVCGRSSEAPGAALVAAIIARRAASCATAAQRTIERRLALLAGADPPEAQPGLPWDEGDDDDDGPSDATLAIAGLDDRSREIDWLEQLASLAAAATDRSSKLSVVRRLLRRTGESLIVFSEYRDVVRTVAARIADLSTVAVLHGGLSAPERQHQLTAFAQGRARTLVTTDAAGEGLNLQAHCRLVVNFEPPWNPLRLEQRIGRVDRIGQHRRVHALQLLHRESFEARVAARFEERRARVAAGEPVEQAMPADRVAEMASGDSASSLSGGIDPLTISSRSSETGAGTAIRSRRLGALAGSHAAEWPARAICAAGSAKGHRPQAVLVFATDLVDGAHRLVERTITTLRVELASGSQGLGHVAGYELARLARDQRICEAVAVANSVARRELALSLDRAAERAERRIAALRRFAASRRAHRPIQTSLFDRREEQRAQLRDAAVDTWIRNFQRHAESASAMRTVNASAPQLVAAWVE